MEIKHPREPFKITDAQKKKYLAAIIEGHGDDLACVKADIPLQAKTDAIAAIGEVELDRARVLATLPIATVRERANDIMRKAKEDEMPLREVLDILARKDSSWSPTQKHDHTTKGKELPQPILAALRSEDVQHNDSDT